MTPAQSKAGNRWTWRLLRRGAEVRAWMCWSGWLFIIDHWKGGAHGRITITPEGDVHRNRARK